MGPVALQVARTTRFFLQILRKILQFFTKTSFIPQLVVLFLLYKVIQNFNADDILSRDDPGKSNPVEKRDLPQSFTSDADMNFVIFQQAKMSAELQKSGFELKNIEQFFLLNSCLNDINI